MGLKYRTFLRLPFVRQPLAWLLSRFYLINYNACTITEPNSDLKFIKCFYYFHNSPCSHCLFKQYNKSCSYICNLFLILINKNVYTPFFKTFPLEYWSIFSLPLTILCRSLFVMRWRCVGLSRGENRCCPPLRKTKKTSLAVHSLADHVHGSPLSSWLPLSSPAVGFGWSSSPYLHMLREFLNCGWNCRSFHGRNNF